MAVAAVPEARDTGVAAAGGVILRAVQGEFIPAGGHPERLVRVAGEDGVAAGGFAAGDRPVVGAGRVLGAHRVGGAGIVRRHGAGKHKVFRCFRREVESLQGFGQELGGFGGDETVDAAIERPPEAAGGGDDVTHGKGVRLVADKFEFDREVIAHCGDAGIDAGNEGFADGAGGGVDQDGFAVADLGDADGEMCDVGGEVGRTEDFGLTTERAAAQAVHLPKAIFSHGDAEAEIDVRRGGAIDMRHAGLVAQDFDAAVDGSVKAAIARRGAGGEPGVAGGGECGVGHAEVSSGALATQDGEEIGFGEGHG